MWREPSVLALPAGGQRVTNPDREHPRRNNGGRVRAVLAVN